MEQTKGGRKKSARGEESGGVKNQSYIALAEKMTCWISGRFWEFRVSPAWNRPNMKGC